MVCGAMKKVFVSVVLGSYNRLDYLTLAIESIRLECKSLSHEIIVVDGGSDDGSIQWLFSQKDIVTIVQHNRGEWDGQKIEQRPWGYFMNLAFKCAQGKYVCMLSDDCLLVPGAILNGVNYFDQLLNFGQKIGAMAFYWRHWGQEDEYRIGTPMGDKIYVNHGLYLNQALNEVGYCDEESYNFYFGDIDLCFKLWSVGYKCIDSPNSFVEHYPHATVKIRAVNEGYLRQDNISFFNKWVPFFPELKSNRNIGQCLKKTYQDDTFTGAKFKNLHAKNVKENPQLLNPPVNYKHLFQGIKSKIKSGIKKILRVQQ